MGDSGVLPPEARSELLDGRVIDMSPIGPFHGGVVNRLSRLLNLEARGRWIVSTQNPLHLDDYSELQPDLMLLKPAAHDYLSRHPVPADVLLLIEVSETTLAYDREQKLPAYARAGVREFWIVDLVRKAIEIYRNAEHGGYGSKSVLTAGADEVARPEVFPDLAVDLRELLKP